MPPVHRDISTVSSNRYADLVVEPIVVPYWVASGEFRLGAIALVTHAPIELVKLLESRLQRLLRQILGELARVDLLRDVPLSNTPEAVSGQGLPSTKCSDRPR